MPRPIRIGKAWYSDIRVRGSDGKIHRLRRRLSKNYQEAESKLAEMVRLRDNEKWGDPTGDLSLDLFEAKYAVYSQGEKKKGTQYWDKVSLAWLRKVIPIQRLSQITPELLEQAKYRWKLLEHNPNTINRRLTAIKAALRKAVEWNYTPQLPWSKVKEIKTTLARHKFFTIEELSRLLKYLDKDYRTTAYIAGRAGLRIGEIQHLETSDIDFKLNRINIIAHPGWEPKDYEKRFIPMPNDLAKFLKQLLTRQDSILAHRWTGTTLSAMMSRLMKQGGFDGTTHTLRHTYASHLVMAGVPMLTVSKLLGHASVTTTEIHYAHLAQSHIDSAADKLPALCS
jgi:integrase